MSPTELEFYLHEHIPLSRAMDVSVREVHPERVVLRAPLAPNINHQETIFGGSASAVAILAAWSLVHTRLADAGIGNRLVIQRNSMDYQLPIAGAFTARSFIAEPEAWQAFLRMLTRKGRARITASATLEFNDTTVGYLEGEFVAFATER